METPEDGSSQTPPIQCVRLERISQKEWDKLPKSRCAELVETGSSNCCQRGFYWMKVLNIFVNQKLQFSIFNWLSLWVIKSRFVSKLGTLVHFTLILYHSRVCKKGGVWILSDSTVGGVKRLIALTPTLNTVESNCNLSLTDLASYETEMQP